MVTNRAVVRLRDGGGLHLKQLSCEAWVAECKQ